MSEELQGSEWDNYTPEQKHLFQVWIKSLEEAQAASINLIKSFNNTEPPFEAKNTSNTASFTRNFDSNFILSEASGIPLRVGDLPKNLLLVICQSDCFLKPESNRQQCIEDCREKHK
ncbi:hypothetical protein VB620_16285 [Nodularia harveyana UHCC-0300]|uniref:Uncharacterized protein n=1 Tax=Nodularia harveyana UHCC-0300 TaxID=2974287 RepID=A0ABU5UHB1_9CYAN|nr:hypothetical protein [Nodularia harveyana]MEA5582895.1 hypothetical protein [Nodularia harveyana UHCC-0300]